MVEYDSGIKGVESDFACVYNRFKSKMKVSQDTRCMSKVKEQEMNDAFTSHDNARISSMDTAVVTSPSFSLGRLLDGVILAHLPHKIFECLTHVPISLR
jgi:hypothetical protein